jgi:hypothetical protein
LTAGWEVVGLRVFTTRGVTLPGLEVAEETEQAHHRGCEHLVGKGDHAQMITILT